MFHPPSISRTDSSLKLIEYKQEKKNKEFTIDKNNQIDENKIKICSFCLENENESNLCFFSYINNENYFLIKQCFCTPDIHEECLMYFIENCEKPICIICKKELALLKKTNSINNKKYLVFCICKYMYLSTRRFFIICTNALCKLITFFYFILFIFNLFFNKR